jgi:putative inorganic carbon (HCO3(-)) transporter
MIRDFPFTGIGIGSYVEVGDILYPFFLFVPGQIVHSHNLFFQVAVDLGVPGLVAWLVVFLMANKMAWQIYRQARIRKDYWAAGLGAGLLGSQIALAVHGLTDAVTWGMVRTAPLVWALWGLAMAGGHVYSTSPEYEFSAEVVIPSNLSDQVKTSEV